MSKVSTIEASTLIFIGKEDKRVLPQNQGIPFYKALKSQQKSITALYHYPGTLSLKSLSGLSSVCYKTTQTTEVVWAWLGLALLLLNWRHFCNGPWL